MAKRRTRGQAKAATVSVNEEKQERLLSKDSVKTKENNAQIQETSALLGNHKTTPMKIFVSDILDSSQSVCEVEWDARSPITMTQAARYQNQSVDITELVQNYAEEIERPSDSPPLLGLWMDNSNENEEGTKGFKYRAQRLPRHRTKRSRGQQSGLKASSKEMLLRLEAVLQMKPEEEGLPAQSAENQQRKSSRIAANRTEATASTSSSSTCPSDQSFELFETSEQPSTSTQKMRSRPLPLAETLKIKHSPILKAKKSPLTEKKHQEKCSVGKTTPNRPMVSEDKLLSPEACQDVNKSLEDLWTDEDLFDDDSFIIKATQGAFDTGNTPRPLKRKTPQSSPEVTLSRKCSRYTFSLGASTKEVKSEDKTTIGPGVDSGNSKLAVEHNKNIASSVQIKTSVQRKEFKFVKPRAGRSPLAVARTKNILKSNQNQAAASTIPLVKQNPTPPITNSRAKCTSAKPQCSKIDNTTMAAPMYPNKTLKHSAIAIQERKSSAYIKTDSKNKLIGRVQATELKPGTKTKTFQHSTPQRSGKSTPPMDTSLTDELLASLAEPDEILDSQVQEASLLNSQVYREILSLSPEEVAMLDSDSDVLEAEIKCPPPVSRLQKENVPVEAPRGIEFESQDPFLEDDFDEFNRDDEDEALSEQQLLAMLEIVESQACEASVAQSAVKTSSVENKMDSKTRSDNTNDKPFNDTALSVKTEQLPITGNVNPMITSTTSPKFVYPKPLNSNTEHISNSTHSSGSSCSTKSPSLTPSVISESIGNGGSQHGAKASQKYSKEEIERKKQEALKKRQNRLKLGKPK